MDIKPVIDVTFTNSSLSGGYKRLYEVLKRGKSAGIDYVIVIDSKSCENVVKIFPDFMEIIGNYKAFKLDFEKTETNILGLRQLHTIKRIIKRALFISRVAKEQNADLIITPSEGTERVITSYLASFFSSKPWTAIFQPTEDLLQPSCFLGRLNLFSIFEHVGSKSSTKHLSFMSKIGLSINLFVLLKLAEKTIISTVSESVVEDFSYINPLIKFSVIRPGNGIEPTEFHTEIPETKNYNCVFFARLIPEKGVFDLPEIWKLVVKKIPNAKLSICGITEKPDVVKKLLANFGDDHLHKTVEFFGTQEKHKLYNVIANARLTIYPSYIDSFSLVTLESLGCGTPVVSYDIPAIRHNFSECNAIFMCPLGDKLAMANKIFDVLTKLEKKPLAVDAKKFTTRFSWNAVVLAEKEVYLKIVESLN